MYHYLQEIYLFLCLNRNEVNREQNVEAKILYIPKKFFIDEP